MAKKGLHGLGKGIPTKEHRRALAKEIIHASDRSVAILLTNYLDECLRVALWGILPNRDDNTPKDRLFSDFGVLGTLSAKISMAHAMMLFGDVTYKNLETIRKIRNVFAHSAHPLTFRTPEIRAACKSLVRLPAVYRMKEIAFRSSRDKFVATVYESSHTVVLQSTFETYTRTNRSGWMVPMP